MLSLGVNDDSVKFGSGIRILNQDPFEMIISFIISANNNIKRIQSIIEKLSTSYGKKMNGYHAFPTLDELLNASLEELKSIGLGYRAKYIYDTVRLLKTEDYSSWVDLDETALQSRLLKLKGVGEKVADCIMLFGYHKMKVFPVDTWIEKVYYDLNLGEAKDRGVMRKKLIDKFSHLSGYAQQYLFYYKRSGS